MTQSQWWWVEHAACRFSDSSLFDIPHDNEGATVAHMMAAVNLCASCPVRAECEATARRNAFVGIWGGVLFHGNRADNLLDRESAAWFDLRESVQRAHRRLRARNDERESA